MFSNSQSLSRASLHGFSLGSFKQIMMSCESPTSKLTVATPKENQAVDSLTSAAMRRASLKVSCMQSNVRVLIVLHFQMFVSDSSRKLLKCLWILQIIYFQNNSFVIPFMLWCWQKRKAHVCEKL